MKSEFKEPGSEAHTIELQVKRPALQYGQKEIEIPENYKHKLQHEVYKNISIKLMDGLEVLFFGGSCYMLLFTEYFYPSFNSIYTFFKKIIII